MLDAERETGKFVQVGYKKMFFPAIAKAKEIISRTEEFGEPAHIFVRYPQAPAAAGASATTRTACAASSTISSTRPRSSIA